MVAPRNGKEAVDANNELNNFYTDCRSSKKSRLPPFVGGRWGEGSPRSRPSPAPRNDQTKIV